MKKIIYIAFAVISAVSCSDFLDKEPKVICSDTFYSSAQEAQYGLNAVYGAMSGTYFYGRYYGIHLCLTDDLCWCLNSSYTNVETRLEHNASTATIYGVWCRIYEGIKNANEFLEAIEDSEFDPDGNMYAQARFLRAYYHFLLAEGWGDVPLRDSAVKSYEGTHLAATPQYDVLKWCASEMTESLPQLAEDLDGAPSKVVRNTAYGILARLYLFMAGQSVKITDGASPEDYYKSAMECAHAVIESGKHSLNPSYSDIFTNYMSNKYDRTYNESMWEVEFLGDATSADYWSNGMWGNLIGMRATGASNTDYGKWVVNYSAAWYKGSIKLWDLYMITDRTDEENDLAYVTDKRQDWVLAPYTYAGESATATHTRYPYGGDPSDIRQLQSGIDKTPYGASQNSTNQLPLTWPGNRYVTKYRRDVECEGNKDWQSQYTCNNLPLLRYADVLLMYAEAYNEYYGAPDEEAYNCVKLVRNRAGIQTPPLSEYSDQAEFRELVRNERARELCCETTRRFDLIRWGVYVSAMKESYSRYNTDPRCAGLETYSTIAAQLASTVSEKHQYFPIPSIELGVNPLLKQNPLW